MKRFLISFWFTAIIYPNYSTAQEKPPPWMAGGKLVFVPEDPALDNKVYKADEYGIFLRRKKKKRIPCRKCKEPKIVYERSKPRYIFKRHRLGLALGYGPNGHVEIDQNGEVIGVKSVYEYLGGVRYAYSFSPSWAMSGQVISSESLTAPIGMVGFDWGW